MGLFQIKLSYMQVYRHMQPWLLGEMHRCQVSHAGSLKSLVDIYCYVYFTTCDVNRYSLKFKYTPSFLFFIKGRNNTNSCMHCKLYSVIYVFKWDYKRIFIYTSSLVMNNDNFPSTLPCKLYKYLIAISPKGRCGIKLSSYDRQ